LRGLERGCGRREREEGDRPPPPPLLHPSLILSYLILSSSPNVAYDLADASASTPRRTEGGGASSTATLPRPPTQAPPAARPGPDPVGEAGARADRAAAAKARGDSGRRAFGSDLGRRRVANQPSSREGHLPAPEEPIGGISHVADPAILPDAWGGEVEDGWGSPPPRWPGNKKAPVTAASPFATRRMTYSQLWQLIAEGKVASVAVDADGGGCTAALGPGAPGGPRTERVGLPFDPAFLDHLTAHGVAVEALPPPSWAMQAAAFGTQSLFPMAFSIGLAWAVLQTLKLGGGGDSPAGAERDAADKVFAGPRLSRLDKGGAGVDFSDVAGIDAVKAEIFEIVEFLRNPDRFTRVGARSPAGVLLAGAPGTGKTLLARAVAGEAGVPFFSTAGSDFMETFVGMGASKIRDVFQAARAASPCVLFIDEFDGIGSARTTAAGASEGMRKRRARRGGGWNMRAVPAAFPSLSHSLSLSPARTNKLSALPSRPIRGGAEDEIAKLMVEFSSTEPRLRE